MTQNAALFNLDNSAPLDVGCWIRFIKSKEGPPQDDRELVYALWRPPQNWEKRIVTKPWKGKYCRLRGYNGGSFAFSSMPNEIMDLILSSLHDALDIASFAMTSARNYEISRAHLEDKNNFVLWAGERIICVGSYAGWNDLPHEPFTGEELQRMYLQNEAHPDWGLDQHFEELRGSFPLDATVTSDPDRFWGHLSRRCQSAALKKDYSTLRSLTITTGTPAYDRMYKKITDPYVLRNLCTRQYIRGDTFQGPMCFHLALMIMTMRCYHELEDFLRLTEHQRISEPPPDAILSFRAPWVGHRFDIVELSRVEEAFPGSVIEFKEKDRTREDRQWTDISRGFKRLSRNVFKGRKLVLAK